jgi:starvation-inducible DNA-binding protein
MTTLERPATVASTLNRNQANAMVMYQNYKKYHWLSFGPHFRDLHLLFDEHATDILAMIDEFAERALMIDAAPLTDPALYLPTSSIKASTGTLSMADQIQEAIGNHDRIIAEMHTDAGLATDNDDIGTADLYTRLVQVHQKQRWFLKEVLKGGDKLPN